MASATAGLVAAPFIRVLNNRAYAQPMTGPKRLMVFFSPNGMVPQLGRPPTSGTNFQILDAQVLSPLRPHQEDLIVLDGLDFVTGNNHEGGMTAMLTNGYGSSTNGRSVDQVIAEHIGAEDRFPSLEFGVLTDSWGASIQTRMCYSANGQFTSPGRRFETYVRRH